MVDEGYLHRFASGVIEAALWADTYGCRDVEEGIEPLETHDYSDEDVDDETRWELLGECIDFIESNMYDLAVHEQMVVPNGWSAAEQAGHDFHLTRNGHGAGFWDRGLGALGERLTEACRPYGEFALIETTPGALGGF